MVFLKDIRGGRKGTERHDIMSDMITLKYKAPNSGCSSLLKGGGKKLVPHIPAEEVWFLNEHTENVFILRLLYCVQGGKGRSMVIGHKRVEEKTCSRHAMLL